MAYTIPSDGKAFNSPAHPGDHNNIADMLTLLAGGGMTFNVKNTAYGGGATGNGSTDDTAAINAAITAAEAAGGIAFVPPGTYKLSSALAFTGVPVSFIGAGQGAVTFNQASTTANGITVHGAGVLSQVRLQDFTLIGPGSGSGIGISVSSSTTDDPIEQLVLRNLTIASMGSHGVYALTPIVSVFDNVASQDHGGRGFYVTGVPADGVHATSCSFTACYANNNALDGYYLQTLAYSSLNGCGSDTNATGYVLAGCECVALNGCGAEDTTAKNSLSGDSFIVTEDSSGNISQDVTLTSCKSLTNNAVAFYVTGGSLNVALIGALEESPGGSATASVKTDAGTSVSLLGYTAVTATSLASQTTTTLNDGTGAVSVAGTTYVSNIDVYGTLVIESGAGTSTAGTATATTPSLSTTVAAQVNTAQDVILYANIKTASTFSLAIGATNVPGTTIVASGTAGVGLISVRVPAAWYVKSTFASADVTWTAVTC